MGKAKLLRVTMERNTLRATTPLVSDKVAKTLIARNAFYEKELSDVYKTVEKEKNYCAVSFQKSKKDFIRSIDLKESADWASKKICVLEKDSSGAVFETESRTRSSSLPTSLNLRRAKLHLSRSSSLSIENKAKQNGNSTERDCTSMYDGYRPHSPLSRRRAMQAVQSPDSPTSEMQFDLKSASFQSGDSKDDVFDSHQRVFDAQSLGSSPTDSQTFDADLDIPAILVSEADTQLNESPQRKTSLTKRSYSTGDLQNVLTESKNQMPSPSSSPLLRRALSSCVNSDSSKQNWTESSNNETKYGSLDESLFQRFNDMLMEAKIPQRPKPRPKLYTEEPFYLRKKCVIRRCLQNKTDMPVKPGNRQSKEKSDQDRERPLAEILPPIALPSIYTQQNNKVKLNGTNSEKNKNKMTGIKRTNAKTDMNDPAKLTENLNDCRYLRNQTKR